MLWLDALPQSMIVLAEAKMHDRGWNSMGIQTGWIDRHIVPVIGCDFAPAPKGQISRLHFPHALLKCSSIARQPGSLVGEHVTRIVDLKSPAPDVIGLAKKMVVTGHVDVIGGAILVGRLLSFEFLQINAHRLIQVTVEMMPDPAVGIGESRRDIWATVN